MAVLKNTKQAHNLYCYLMPANRKTACHMTDCLFCFYYMIIQDYSSISAYMKYQYPYGECQDPVILLLCSQKSL